MHKTITLRLDSDKYDLIKHLAELENRPISNFIETATIKYIQANEYADEFEMEENTFKQKLNESIARGIADANANRGRFI
ncbi:MAG: CopG family transcriptional regulator [Fibrobacteres bacterium]|nr:CopG family transcriptional regulator [Fibrobacterota bacterium]